MQFKDIGKLFTKNLLIAELIIILVLIILGTLIFHYFEGLRILDSVYFVVCTMSTIGFGDIAPQTEIGKIFVMIYAVTGVPLFVSIGGLFLESRFKLTIERYMKKVHKEIQTTEIEIQEAEAEIQTVEKSVKKLKVPVQVTEEKVENLQDQIEETTTKTRWKKIWKK